MNGNSLTKNGALEMEPIHSEEEQPTQTPVQFLHSLSALIMAYASYYRGITASLLAACFILLVVISLDALTSHAHSKFHHLSKDYSSIPSLYELKMAHIDHWCLQGGDNDCKCNDPTVPLSREEVKGWTKTHVVNKLQSQQNTNWDVVLLGDEFVQDFTGRILNQPTADLKNVYKYWNATFTLDGGESVDGVALGISGDSISNLFWRIQHGELPESKVYWIHIGTNDFGIGMCSEESVLLGILRLAEWIHEEQPDSVIVLNSILPRQDDNLKQGVSGNVLWSAIQEVNHQLEKFCVNHEHLVYFDASPLFVNSNLKKKNPQHLRNPMYLNDKFHLSYQGHTTWGNAILERLKLILYDDDETSS
jgi:lysophospholipase L1-like esterase